MYGDDGVQTCGCINQLKRVLWQYYLHLNKASLIHFFLIFACLINLVLEKVKCPRKDHKCKSALQYKMHVKGHSGKGIAQFCGA